jgi:hypothetical protein
MPPAAPQRRAACSAGSDGSGRRGGPAGRGRQACGPRQGPVFSLRSRPCTVMAGAGDRRQAPGACSFAASCAAARAALARCNRLAAAFRSVSLTLRRVRPLPFAPLQPGARLQVSGPCCGCNNPTRKRNACQWRINSGAEALTSRTTDTYPTRTGLFGRLPTTKAPFFHWVNYTPPTSHFRSLEAVLGCMGAPDCRGCRDNCLDRPRGGGPAPNPRVCG